MHTIRISKIVPLIAEISEGLTMETQKDFGILIHHQNF